jgi:CBS domain-containing protein
MTPRSMAEIIKRRSPTTLGPGATVQHACRLMREQRIGAVLVTGDEGRLLGLFTGRDAVGRVAAEGRDAAKTRLQTVMTRNPDTLRPGATAIDALRMMQHGGYRHMPVVDGEKLVGIVSFGDFQGMELARLDEESGFWEIL